MTAAAEQRAEDIPTVLDATPYLLEVAMVASGFTPGSGEWADLAQVLQEALEAEDDDRAARYLRALALADDATLHGLADSLRQILLEIAEEGEQPGS